jgi:predicted secreted protein
MQVTTAIAIYFLIWWIVLFAVLPWGVRAQGEQAEPGSDPGAPTVPRIRAKLIWTTVVAAVVWAVAALVYWKGWVTLDGLLALLRMPTFNRY